MLVVLYSVYAAETWPGKQSDWRPFTSPLVPKKHLGDKVRQDLNIFSIDERTWYMLAHNRQEHPKGDILL